MSNIQLYTGENGYFSQEQVSELNKPLDASVIKERPGGGRKLKYITGKTAMDTANDIFGYGNWAFRLLSMEQVILTDPLTGEAVGIEYKATGELTVRGAVAPMVDVGSQPVASWNVYDLIMQRRINEANNNHTAVDESPFTPIEKKQARATIVEAHEQAKKAAATDVEKRLFRQWGSRFGLALYDEDSLVELEDGSLAKVKDVKVSPTGNTVAPSKRVVVESTGPSQKDILAEACRRGIETGAWTQKTFVVSVSSLLSITYERDTVFTPVQLKKITDAAEHRPVPVEV